MANIDTILENAVKAQAAVEAACAAHYAIIFNKTGRVYEDTLSKEEVDKIMAYYESKPDSKGLFSALDTKDMVCASGWYTEIYANDYGHQEPAFKFYGKTVEDCENLVKAWVEECRINNEMWYVDGTRCTIDGENRNDLLGRKPLTEEQWKKVEDMFTRIFKVNESDEKIEQDMLKNDSFFLCDYDENEDEDESEFL